ncbi:MAG: hypothetical protein K1Y36_12470 [Blastocatellia bacterium]|nr:hypothetical protein [Blastocatellia bacterium]
MDQLNTIETFIVNIEDSTTLLKLYFDRLRRSPGKAATYCEAICQHSEEINEAVYVLRKSLYTMDGELVPWATFHLAASVEGLSDLAELLQYSALRLATQQVSNPTEVLEASTHATSCFEGVVKSLNNLEVPFDLTQIHRITHHLRELLSQGSISASVAQGPSTLAPAPSPEPQEPLFAVDDDPFDELALGEDFFEDVIGGLDDAFDTALKEENSFIGFSTGTFDHELSEVQAADMLASVPTSPPTGEFAIQTPDDLKDLFANIAAAYVQPVKEFMAELRRGKVSKEWLEICRPAVQSIARASESMEYYELSRLLRNFDELLASAQNEPDNRAIKINWQAKLLKSYADLEELLPQTFGIPETTDSPEGIIINSLLKQVKGVGQGTIKKLFAIGMTSLDLYYLASPSDVAAAAGLKLWLAERILERFQEYQTTTRQLEQVTDQNEHRLLALHELIDDLKRQQFLFKQATIEDWYSNSNSEGKKQSRKERQRKMWQVNVLLAELGELDLIQEIKNLVFEKRIERLQEFLEEHPIQVR